MHTHWETPALTCGGGGWAFPVSLSSTMSLVQKNCPLPGPAVVMVFAGTAFLQHMFCQGVQSHPHDSWVSEGGHLPGVRGLAQLQSGCKVCNVQQ